MHACSLSTSRAACLPASAHLRSALRALFLRPALFTLAACSYRGRVSLARRLFASYALSLLISERRVCVCARLASISLQSTVTPRCIMHVDVGVKIASLRFVCVCMCPAPYIPTVRPHTRQGSFARRPRSRGRDVEVLARSAPSSVTAAWTQVDRLSAGRDRDARGAQAAGCGGAERVGSTTHAYGERTCT